MKALQHVNVETVIVFRQVSVYSSRTIRVYVRSCSPLAVSFFDYYYLGRELPSGKVRLSTVGIGVARAMALIVAVSNLLFQSWLALFGIVLGAFLYMVSDDGMQVGNG